MGVKQWLILSTLSIFAILTGVGASLLIKAYTTDVKMLTTQAQVVSAKCHYMSKNSDICYADLVLTFMHDHKVYTNVSVDNIPSCGYFCEKPLPPNAIVFIAFANDTSEDVTVVQSTDVYHHKIYMACGIIAIFVTLIMILCVLNLALNYFKDWQTRREQLRDEFRVPLTIASA